MKLTLYDATPSPTTWATPSYVDDIIAKGPVVDIRAFIDGESGRPAYADWVIAQTTTDVTSVFEEAIDNVPTGGTLYLPTGTYYVTAEASPIILVDKRINIIGDGMWASIISVASGVGAAIDAIKIDIAGSAYGMTLSDFAIVPASGNPCRYGINLETDASLQQFAWSFIHHVRIGEFGDYGLYINNTQTDGFFDNYIHDNFISGGVNFIGCGDAVRVERNYINGGNFSIKLTSMITGAGAFRCRDNVFIGTSGGMSLGTTRDVLIDGNEFEQQLDSDGTKRALITITGKSTHTTITNNYFVATDLLCDTVLDIADGDDTYIDYNDIVLGNVTQTVAVIGATAINTRFGKFNYLAAGALLQGKITDGGSQTTVDHGEYFTAISGATPSVAAGKYFTLTQSGAVTVTDLLGGIAGQKVIIIFGDNNTTVDFSATNLKGNAGADYAATGNDWMECIYTGTAWHCAVHDCNA